MAQRGWRAEVTAGYAAGSPSRVRPGMPSARHTSPLASHRSWVGELSTGSRRPRPPLRHSDPMGESLRHRLTRDERAHAAAEFAEHQGGVVSRAQLRSRSVTRADVRSEVAAGRWHLAGRHTVVIGAGPLRSTALRWRAVWESGAGAALDGVAALAAAGLTGFDFDRIDVSLPHANRHHRVDGVRVTRRRCMPRTVSAGIPRVHPAPAVLHAAGWAKSDRQAALLLCLVVQQRLVRPADLMGARRQLGRCRRRPLVGAIVADVCDGVHSLGELDFGKLCRDRGLPAPARQVVRTTAQGRVYLDVAWEDISLVVEIDGGHHAAALNSVDDALRQNASSCRANASSGSPSSGCGWLPTASWTKWWRPTPNASGRWLERRRDAERAAYLAFGIPQRRWPGTRKRARP